MTAAAPLSVAGDACAPPTSPSRLERLGAGVERLGFFPRWLILGGVIGTAAGLGSVTFYEALRLGAYLFLDLLGGDVVSTPVGEGGVAGSSGFSRPWAIPLTVGLGGLLSGLLIFGLAPEAEGHGTDSAIDAVHHNPTGIRARVSAVKILASALTIGSGGSGGREGPTGQISAGFASLLGAKTGLSEQTTRLGVTAGIGSGIGAIFSAPLGGTILGPEILFKNDFEAKALVPSLVASVTASSIFGLFVGYGPLLGSHERYGFQLGDTGYYLLIGLIAGVIGRAYSTGFYRITRTFQTIQMPKVVRPMLGGLAVGAIALVVPQVLGTGYGDVQKAMDLSLLGLPLWLVLVIPLARIVTTGLSIGSGGSGGIFGPGMVVGAFTGEAVWRVAHDLGFVVPQEPAPFVIIGMAACFGSISHAPLAVLAMVTEMTGSLHLMLGSLMALAVAVVVTGNHNIYKAQVDTREDCPIVPVGRATGTTISVGDVASPPRLVLRSDDTASGALTRLDDLELPGAPVVDGADTYRGCVQRHVLAQSLSEWGDTPPVISQVANLQAVSLPDNLSLAAAVDAVAAARAWVPVVDQRRAVVGILTSSEVLAGYRLDQHRATTTADADLVLVEEHVQVASSFARRHVADLGLPDGSLVASLSRHGHPMLPTAETVVEAGDLLGVLTPAGGIVALRRSLATNPTQAEPDSGQGLGPGRLI